MFELNNPDIWLLAFTAIACFTLGTLVYLKKPTAVINRLFLGLTVNIGLWSIAVLLVVLTNEYSQTLFWIRLSHAAAVTIPWFVFALAFAFSNVNPFESKQMSGVLGAFLVVSILMVVLSLTPYVIAGLKQPIELKELIYGPLFFLYGLFMLFLLVFGIYKLTAMMRSARGLLRLQLRYLVVGIAISSIMGILANIILPYIESIQVDIRSIGPVFSLSLVCSVSYAIVRYRLMDMHFALRKGLTFFISIVILSSALVVLLGLLDTIGLPLGDFSLYVVTGIIVVVTLLFHPLCEALRRFVDRYFYRGAYDYHTTLLKTGKAMVSILDLRELLQFVVSSFVKDMYLEGGCFVLRNKDCLTIIVATELKSKGHTEMLGLTIAADSPLVIYLENRGDALLLTDLAAVESEPANQLSMDMTRLKAEAVIPIMVEGHLMGMFLLGTKLSGEPYSREDVKLLTTLAFQVTVCLRNSQLYQEVLVMKRYLEGVLENIGNGLVAVDANGIVTTLNSAAAEQFIRKTGQTVLGKPVEEVLSAELCALLRQTVEDGQCISEVEVTMSAEDSMRYISCSTALMEEPETGGRGAILVISDVTRIKELEQERNTIQRLASLGEVAAGMAHEIKNPLVSIKTFAELLPEKYEDYEFRHNFSRIVSQEIDRINNLVGELLSFSRNTVLRREDVDVGTLVDEVLLLLTPQLDAQKIRLISHFEEGILPVSADRDQLKQAVFNICLNAIQAMPNGGRLRVGVTGVKGGEGEAGWQAGKIRVFVEDTGIGISALERERIFDPFFTTKAEGTGIGLSISHRIVHDHGGTIQVRSNNGSTMFEIYLPRKISSSNDQERFGQGRGDSA